MSSEQFSPIFRELFVQMMLATLPRCRGRKEHDRSMRDKVSDERSRARRRQVLGNLKALRKIEPASEVEWAS
jgi:hypothetical protein